MNTVHVYNFPN